MLRKGFLLFAVFLLTPSFAFTETIDVKIKGVDDGVKTTKQQDYKEAVLFAKREAVERAGIKIKTLTTAKDFVVHSDYIESKAEAVLMPGYEVVDIGYTEDGSYQIVLIGKISIRELKEKLPTTTFPQPAPPPPQPELFQKLDLGTISYTEAPRTWTVDLPPNFERVELGVYAKGKPSVSMYGGWNAYLKINRRYVWKFIRFQKGVGGIIRNYFLDETVQERSGRNKYINVTKLMKPGPNTIQYYHYTEGDGMGIKLQIYLK